MEGDSRAGALTPSSAQRCTETPRSVRPEAEALGQSAGPLPGSSSPGTRLETTFPGDQGVWRSRSLHTLLVSALLHSEG